MITKTFTATIGVGAGTAYIRPALLEEERRAGAQDWPHGPSAHCPLSSRETCRASCINMVIAVSLRIGRSPLPRSLTRCARSFG